MPAATTESFSSSRFRIVEWVKRIRQALAAHWEEHWEASSPQLLRSPWERYWGGTYSPELKRWLLKPVFEQLEKEGKIGDVIVDAGSGAAPVTALLERKPARKRILVDIAADNNASANEQRIQLDLEKVAEPDALSMRKALSRVRRFLEASPDAKAIPPGADMIVFSDVLNYVDFQKVLGGFTNYLKAGGRAVIVNMPMRGNPCLFSENGLTDNRQLCRYLEKHGFEIEMKSFPKRTAGSTEESEELIVLVARKCGRSG
ncbi:MAG: hypothetical protein ABSE62_16205 [Chthoniobacteraceae bacterium]|jgi:SAM-dependent methyltransferase